MISAKLKDQLKVIKQYSGILTEYDKRQLKKYQAIEIEGSTFTPYEEKHIGEMYEKIVAKISGGPEIKAKHDPGRQLRYGS
jgi:hypothetical protein